MKILLLFYYPGAGGKYVANLLSHSHHVAFADNKVAHMILENPAQIVSECLATIPNQTQARQWVQHENGCEQLFGKNIWHVKSHDLLDIYPAHGPWFDNTALDHQWLPLVAHGSDQLLRQQKFFANHKIFTVFVNAVPEFVDCAIRLKWPEPHHCLDLDLYRQFIESSKNIQFDYELQWDPRDRNQYHKISDLAQKLGFNFHISTANAYKEKYIDFHTKS